MAESGSVRAGRAYVELGADSKELEAKVKKGQSLLDQLKKGLGEESKLGGLGKILAGAGAVGGLALSARLLNDMAGGAVKWRDAMAAGGDAAGKATEELIASLPVLGQIREAGLNIRELFTGEQAAAKAMTDEVSRLNAIMDSHQRIVAAAAKGYDEVLGTLRKLREEGSLIGTKGPQRQLMEQAFALRDRLEKQAQDAAKRRADIEASGMVEIDRDGKKVKITPDQRRKEIITQLQGMGVMSPAEEARAREIFENSGVASLISEFGDKLRENERMKAARLPLEQEFKNLNRESQGRDARQFQIGTKNIEATLEAFKVFGKQIGEIGAGAAQEFWDKWAEQTKRLQDEELARFEREIEEMMTPDGFAIARDYAAAAGQAAVEMGNQLEKSVQRAVATQGGAVGGRTVGGTFSPFAVGGLGGTMQDVAENTRRSARALERIEQKQNGAGGGIVYQ